MVTVIEVGQTTVQALPFMAVLLGCSNRHYEATTQDDNSMISNLSVCARCDQPLGLLKTVTIWPGGRR